ncbi:MAG TPA: multidrug effflux MFS transporter [Cyclobacteriaceae bacterium]|nr:multidrug effflux MFS transporter [Cyclobacteriaceae bacterium]HMV09874.1 multidrug effflux MFS transporter [Cyclobacteriaceae bacterium]HMV88700.1 multidrug effflux MFS transporter [Cyclobacteriaceae bacterium]HMW99612.1 multidrug effflux MFS transporter [Cyclobacteriaceae bacterium]HMX51011.1 multidrug effflux MFS transporter [Cyclobacteriaceae bacterium]
MSDRQKYYFFIILILGALATISPFSIDMYLPGFPAIALDLNTSIDQVQLSLTAYLVGIAFGQLLYGPLLDRFGRKRPLYVGLTVYILASIGCAFTESIHALIFMRFLQALGGCAGIVSAQALVRDIFPVNKTAQAFALITLVISVSPMIAPTVGGYVTAHVGWQYVFAILATITLLILTASYFFLPKGRGADPSVSLKPKAVAKNFYTVVRNPQFLMYAVTGGIASAAPFAYIAGSPSVFMNIYGLTEQQYGWVFALLAFAMIGSTQLNHVILKKFTSEQVIRFALLYQTFTGLILVAGVYFRLFNVYSLIAMMFIFFAGQGITGPNATALSLAPFSKQAGSASALFGSWRLGAGGIISAIVSLFHNNTALPMVTTMAGCAIIGLIILSIGNFRVKYKARKKQVEEATSIIHPASQPE